MAETTPRQHRGRPWQPGQSGNPRGRPLGARHKTTLAVEALLEGEAEAVGRVAITKALEGDLTAVKLVLDRVAPARRDRLVSFSLPPLTAVGDAVLAMATISEGLAAAQLTPADATALAGVVETYRRTLETADLERRLAALEARGENQ